MTIEDIISKLESYGYKSIKDYQVDIAWSMQQSFDKIPEKDRTIKEELVIHFKWNKPKSTRNHTEPELNFSLYEDESVSSEGKLYYTPGRMHYFFHFGNDMSKIYRDDQLDLLMDEIHNKMSNRMGVDELRNIKLIDMGI